MLVSETVISAADATNLVVRHYRPTKAKAPRTLMIVHGMSEHTGRYEHVVPAIVRRDWNVLIADLRGHGRSGGPPTHIRRFREYVNDLQVIRKHYRLRPRNSALLGHSMGGLIALRSVQIRPGRFAALVLTSPLLGVTVNIPRLTFTTGKVLSYLAPQTRFRSSMDPSFSTRNEEAAQARLNDPEIYRTVTAGWFFAMRASLRMAWAEAEKIQLPLLLMQAGQDHVVDALASAEWFKAIGSRDKSYVCLEENYHELLNEPDWQNTTSAFMDWLDGRVSTKMRPQRRKPRANDLIPPSKEQSNGSDPLVAG